MTITPRVFTRTLLFAAIAVVASTSVVAKKYPDVSEEGLQRVDSKTLDAVYWAEGAPLGAYEQVLIADVEVSFRKNWQRDQNSTRRGANDQVTEEDMDKIRDAVAEGLVEVFTQELTDAGYTVVEALGSGVLSLNPSIVDLDVNAPDISLRQAGRSSTFTTFAGRMTLDLALYDADSERLIGQVYDHRRARETSDLRFTTSVTNRQEANLMFRTWARALVRALDDAEAG